VPSTDYPANDACSAVVSGQVASSIRDMIGDTGAKAVEAMLADASTGYQDGMTLSRDVVDFNRWKPVGFPSMEYWRRLSARLCRQNSGA